MVFNDSNPWSSFCIKCGAFHPGNDVPALLLFFSGIDLRKY